MKRTKRKLAKKKTDFRNKSTDSAKKKKVIPSSKVFSASFSKKVNNEAKRLEKDFGKILKQEIPKRKDLRKLTAITIDPNDAKDFDDALSIRQLESGLFEVGIHIADVSFFAKPDSAIDKEAKERATSVYIVGKTLHMLPQELSGNICSLKPNEDRLAFSVLLQIDSAGIVKKKWFGKSVINSKRRFTYKEAQKILNRKQGPMSKEVLALNKLAKVLRNKRIGKGSMLFEKEEVEIVLDRKKRPVSISVKKILDTHRLVEEFMLLANKSVAEYMVGSGKKENQPFVFRIHDVPNREKIMDLTIFLKGLGYHLSSSKDGLVRSKDLNALLRQIKNKPEEGLIQLTVLRAMSKAVYSTKNIGHFSLSFKDYSHFTSPIRRYPDLVAHRLLEKRLAGQKVNAKDKAYYEKIMVHSSEREREAVALERDSIRVKQLEYMSKRIGQVFSGVVVGVVDWGIYVEEEKTKTEGLVHITNLGSDFYEHDEKTHQLVGRRRKKKIRLGDKVKVRLSNVNLAERKLDYSLI